MELRHLRGFLTIAARRSFTQAAADLGIAQPALSQQIGLLERDLGVRLFTRSSRRVSLTAAGAAFEPRARAVVEAADVARDSMAAFAGGDEGRITVGTLQTVSERTLPGLIRRFREIHPRIEIALRENVVDRMLAELRRGEIDMGLAYVPPELVSPDLSIDRLYADELAVAVAPGHPLAARGRTTLEALRDEQFIGFPPTTAITRIIVPATAALGFRPRVAYESGDSLTVRAMVAEGLGIAILPRSLLEADGPHVVSVRLTEPRLSRSVSLVRRAGAEQTVAARRFAGFVTAELQR